MKKNFINKLLVGSMAVFFLACSSKNNKEEQHEGHQDTPIDTTVKHLTGPTNQQVVNRTSTITAKKGMRVFPVKITGKITYDSRNNTSLSSRVTGRIERLWVKYNYQPIHKGQLLFEIYSPELVTAQRELLMLRQSKQDQLIPSTIQKLQYMGMHSDQIQQVLKSNTVLYRIPVYSPINGYILEKSLSSQGAAVASSRTPSNTGGGMDAMASSGNQEVTTSSATSINGSQPLLLREGQYVDAGQSLFSIYTNADILAEFALPPHLAPQVQRGKKVLFYGTDDLTKSYQAPIGLIQPTFNAGESFSLARVYLKGIRLPVGQLLNGTLAITVKQGFWLPKEAVLVLGNRSVLFKKDAQTFRPIAVQTGFSTSNEIQVLTDIEMWQIAKNASYLIDSEDFVATTKAD